MTRWKKDAREFSVSLSNDGADSFVCRVPKPILEMLNNPHKIKFMITGKKIEIQADS